MDAKYWLSAALTWRAQIGTAIETNADTVGLKLN
jgi:hypothetical protein